jgi:hypothetical protein
LQDLNNVFDLNAITAGEQESGNNTISKKFYKSD